MEQKKHNMKNFNLRTILLLAVLLGNSVFAFADDTKIRQDKIEYTITDEGIAYVSDADANITTAVIHESITVNGEEYKIRKIGNSAFDGCRRLTSVTIPRSVKIIGEYAFRESGITELFIPSTVNEIGGGCCSNCKNLKKCILEDSDNPITIPGIGSDNSTRAVFCEYLEELYMGRNLKDSIVSRAYYYTTKEYISDGEAFKIKSLRKVTFGPKVTKLVDIDTDNLIEELYIPDNIKGEIDISVCPNLKEFFIGNGITRVILGNQITRPCLKHIYIGNALETLDMRDSYLPTECPNLEYIVTTSHKLKEADNENSDRTVNKFKIFHM